MNNTPPLIQSSHRPMMTLVKRLEEARDYMASEHGTSLFAFDLSLRDLNTIIAALQPNADMVMVPREPTQAMANAAVDATRFHYTAPEQTGWRRSPQMLFEAAYRAMIAATPASQKRAGHDE